MKPGCCVDQLRRNPHPVADLPDAALEDIAYAQLAADLFHIDRLPFVRERRVARDDEEPAQPRQRGDDVLGDAVGEVLLLGVSAHVDERKDGDRGLLRRHEMCSRSRNGDAIDAYRPSDVLQMLGPEVLAVENQLAGDVLANALRYAQAAGFGDLLQPCDHVDSVTEDVPVLDDDIALMYPDAKGHRPVRRDAGVAQDHRALYLDRALDGFDHAGELDQHPVAGRLDRVPMMFRDLRVDELVSVCPEGGKRPRLVDAHEAAVADHVGGQDGGEFAFNFLGGHGIPKRLVGRLV